MSDGANARTVPQLQKLLKEESPLAVAAFKTAFRSKSAEVRVEAFKLWFEYVYELPFERAGNLTH